VLRIWICRIRKCLGLPEPDPLIGGTDPGSETFHYQAKKVRKIFISVVCDFLFLKNVVNVPSKRNRQKLGIFCCLGRLLTEPDPDPLVRDADPKIRIRTKMSRIRNTVEKNFYPPYT
jgi:hypothetical protein